MAKRVAGICYVKVDGAQLEVAGGLECPLSDTQREAVKGTNGTAGFKEEHRTPYVKVNAIFRDDFPMDKVAKSTDMTVTAEFPNGKVYTLSDAFLVGESSAKADDGTTELEFNGIRGIWQ
jgi:hypothetical protein